MSKADETCAIPDRTGWWVGQRNAVAPRPTDNPEPHPVAVTLRHGALCVGTTPVSDPRWTWFGPVPSGAACAALARFRAARDDLRARMSSVEGTGIREAGREEWEAEQDLLALLRAEGAS